MSYESQNKSSQGIENNFIGESATKQVLLKDFIDIGISFPNDTHYTKTIGNSLTLDSFDNGIIGIYSGSENGLPILMGENGTTTLILSAINANNTFEEKFVHNFFEDESLTTADWNITTNQLNMTGGQDAYSKVVAKQNENLFNAKPIVTGTGSFLILLSNNGTTYESVSNNTTLTFSTTGQGLRFRIFALGTVTITNIKIEYNK